MSQLLTRSDRAVSFFCKGLGGGRGTGETRGQATQRAPLSMGPRVASKPGRDVGGRTATQRGRHDACTCRLSASTHTNVPVRPLPHALQQRLPVVCVVFFLEGDTHLYIEADRLREGRGG